MANKDDSGNSWWEKLVIPLILGLALAGTAPWWVTAVGNLVGSADPPVPTPTPEPTSAPTTQEIRKLGYIFRVEGCRTTGEAGAVVCDFLVEAESERKNLQVISRSTSLVDPNGQSYRPSRVDFGSSGSATSARSDLNPGVPIRGAASFSGVLAGVSAFPSFELGGFSPGDGQWIATFFQVPLVD